MLAALERPGEVSLSFQSVGGCCFSTVKSHQILYESPVTLGVPPHLAEVLSHIKISCLLLQ